MISLKKIYQLSFYVVILLTFLIGGFLQFFIGVSNTGLTLLIVSILLVTYFIYAVIKRKVVFNKILLWSLVYVLVIIFSAIVNKTNFISTIIYLLFPLLPLATFLFCYINYKENYLNPRRIFKIFYLIALIQLPIILIQNNFYEYLIDFNNSNQHVASFDFLFGSFFMKSDHSLGVFILCIITSILLNLRSKRKPVKYPVISVIYLGVTIFFTESNISKLFLCLLLASTIIIPIYQKHKKSLVLKLMAVLFGLFIVLFAYNLRGQEFVKKKLGGVFETQYSIKTSSKQYELGTAKRGQILIVVFNKLDIKWIGEGPYSYFNILTGQFKKTIHFSQLIWTYFDLGLMGIMVVVGFLISILKYLEIDSGPPFYITLLVMLVYAFYTTIFSDVSIMFAIIMIFNRKLIK